ncbi:MAG: glycine cleavage system protein GcvH [Thermoplasmata archaeon]|nr:glycine cleavage system protein GcvH [Thermoplasmata archaeon]
MSQIPNELRYTKEHEWVKVTDNEATIGITDHAQNELTDIIFVELPEQDRKIKKGEAMGAVESVKSVSELFSPVNGQVKQVNNELEQSPDMVNKEPYGKGWLIVLTLDDSNEAADLMSADDYKKLIGE